eukprot:2306241-Prymnesium_polylepis.1
MVPGPRPPHSTQFCSRAHAYAEACRSLAQMHTLVASSWARPLDPVHAISTAACSSVKWPQHRGQCADSRVGADSQMIRHAACIDKRR